jgi:hypothetical protein
MPVLNAVNPEMGLYPYMEEFGAKGYGVESVLDAPSQSRKPAPWVKNIIQLVCKL